MIGTIDIKLNAAHPNMPLAPLYTFRGSPSQVRVINVPKAIGKWAVNSVQVIANHPDNSVETVSATLVGGCWSATLVAPTAVGQSLNGFTITASGTDESGAAVTGYVLGKGDLFVLDNDATITIGTATYYVHLVSTTPANPKEGDLALDTMKLWDGSAWRSLGGGAVSSVNGKVGAVVLTGADINYSDSTTVKNAIDNVGDLASAAMSTAGEASSAISAHAGNTNNPHGVSCGQIGAVAITDGVLTQGPSGHLETDAIKSLEGHYIAVPSEDGTMALKSDIPDVSGFITAAALPYPLNEAGTIIDRAINVLTSGAFTIPANFTDLVIRYTGVIASVTFLGGETALGDSFTADSADWLITVTKTKTGEAFIKTLRMEARS